MHLTLLSDRVFVEKFENASSLVQTRLRWDLQVMNQLLETMLAVVEAEHGLRVIILVHKQGLILF